MNRTAHLKRECIGRTRRSQLEIGNILPTTAVAAPLKFAGSASHNVLQIDVVCDESTEELGIITTRIDCHARR